MRRSFQAAGLVVIVVVVPLTLAVALSAIPDRPSGDAAYIAGVLVGNVALGALPTWGIARGSHRRWPLWQYTLVVAVFGLLFRVLSMGGQSGSG